MDFRQPSAWLAVAVCVFGSSALGLRGFLIIWTISLAADVVFVTGSAAVFIIQFILVRHGRVGAVASIVAGTLHWGVYAVAWSIINAKPDLIYNTSNVPAFVARIGWVGLLFAACAPALIRAIQDVRDPGPDPIGRLQ